MTQLAGQPISRRFGCMISAQINTREEYKQSNRTRPSLHFLRIYSHLFFSVVVVNKLAVGTRNVRVSLKKKRSFAVVKQPDTSPAPV